MGDALLSGTRIVARVLDAPMSLMGHIPAVGGVFHSLDPLVKLDHMTGALQRGDFKGLEKMIENDAKMAQGVISLIPGHRYGRQRRAERRACGPRWRRADRHRDPYRLRRDPDPAGHPEHHRCRGRRRS